MSASLNTQYIYAWLLTLKLTVYDVAFLDLLKDLRPDIGVALLVCRNSGGLEMDDLGEAAGLRLSHGEIFNINIIKLYLKSFELELNVRKNQANQLFAFYAPLSL